jgi:hypothetical protein
MANKEAVGKAGVAFDMAVERGKIREFARATKSERPEYLAEPTPPVPPTFLTTAQFWSPPEAGELWREIDIDLRRLLHGEQEYVFPNGPPRAGAVLTAQTRVESVYEKEGKRGGTMTFVVTVTDFTDADGAVVAQARSTAIETGRPPA